MNRERLSRRALAALGAVVLTSATLIAFAAMASTVPASVKLERGRYLLKTNRMQRLPYTGIHGKRRPRRGVALAT